MHQPNVADSDLLNVDPDQGFGESGLRPRYGYLIGENLGNVHCTVLKNPFVFNET